MNDENYRDKILERTILICFGFLLLIHLADMITTVIGLSLGAYETNPLAAYLFRFGILGNILMTTYTISLFAIMLFLINVWLNVWEKITYQKLDIRIECAIFYAISSCAFIGIGSAVLNNIIVILNLI